MLDTLMLLINLAIVIFLLRLAWGVYTRCKRCGGMFTRDLQHHERIHNSPLDHLRRPRELREYRCEKCGYEWEEVIRKMTR